MYSTDVYISGHKIELVSHINLNLKYDSIADSFSFTAYYDPTNPVHKKIFKPLSFQTVKIVHAGVRMVTGTVLVHDFYSAGDPPKSLVQVSGYSITGILQECTVGGFQPNYVSSTNNPDEPTKHVATQFDKCTLPQIANKICGIFPLKVIVDPELLNDKVFMAPYAQVAIKQDEYLSDFLDNLCAQKNAILSHDAYGNILITRAHTGKLLTTKETRVPPYGDGITDFRYAGATMLPNPLYYDIYYTNPVFIEAKGLLLKDTTSSDRHILHTFTGSDYMRLSTGFNGQGMHSIIQVLGQNDSTDAVVQEGSVFNPYIPLPAQFRSQVVGGDLANANVINIDTFGTYGVIGPLRMRRYIQSVGNDNDIKLTARSLLNDELRRAMVITIKINGWHLSGNLVTPNQLISIKDPEVYLFNQSTFFIQEVNYSSDPAKNVATLTCVLPDAFNDNDPIKRIL